VKRAGRANNAVGSGAMAAGLVLALATVVGPTVCTFGRAQEAHHDETGYPRAESELLVSVEVYNYAAVPEATLIKSETETHRIFAKGGVKVDWCNCVILGKRVKCSSRDHSLSAVKMHLSILPGAMAKRLGASDRDGGFATECPAGETACQAYVFYDCAVDLLRAGCCADAGLWQILGVMAAHELGHLLLGIGSHSPVGVMRPRWDAPQYQAAARGQLVFTPQQAERLRAELRKRMALRKGPAGADGQFSR